MQGQGKHPPELGQTVPAVQAGAHARRGSEHIPGLSHPNPTCFAQMGLCLEMVAQGDLGTEPGERKVLKDERDERNHGRGCFLPN